MLIPLSLLIGCPRPDDSDPPGVAVDPACAAAGCLRSVEDLGRWDRGALEPFLLPGVSIDNGYRVFVVHYATGDDAVTSTATVTLPVDAAEEPAAGWPIVVNAHGTIGLDDPCQLSGTVSGSGLAGLFGARGAIGVAPDYRGLGGPGFHPYLDTKTEGEAVLDAIRAASALAELEGWPTRGTSAVTGLSQGGHAVFAAASQHQRYAPELDVRAFGAAAPASAWEEQWRPGVTVPGPHLATFALLAWSWADQAGADDAGVWAAPLGTQIDGLVAERCAWSPTFTGEPLLGDAIATSPSDVFAPAFLDAFASGDWPPAFAFMREGFARNRVGPFTSPAPIHVWQGTADEVVLPWMTEALVDDLVAGGMDVELTLVPGGTHTDTAFGFVAVPERATDASIAWVKSRL